MPANIATTNGKPAIAVYGEPAWHRLGTQLDEPATAEQAIVAAGLDYEVSLAAMTTTEGLPVPKSRAVVRTDSRTVLGVVGERYVPVQNRQAFGFLDAVVADRGLRYHTAGALGRGEKIWLLAKLPGHIRVRNTDDLVDKYLLLSNAHDGTAALRAFFTPIRVVCQNTLSLAHARGEGQGVSIRHNGDLAGKIQDAQRVLGLAQKFYDDAQTVIDRLAGSYPTGAQLMTFFEALYPDPTEGIDNSRAVETRSTLLRLFDEGIGHDSPGIKGTAWAALNAVTEYVDHARPTRGGAGTNRLNSIWFGNGAQVKQKAWDLSLALAGIN